MKKTVLLGASLLMLLLLLPSCSTFKQGTNKTVNTTFTPVVTQPRFTLYTVDFKNKATGVVTGKLSKTATKQMFIDLATTNAILSTKCDFLFEPTSTVDVKGRNVTVNVYGYAGYYSGFEPVNMGDSTEYANYKELLGMKNAVVQGGKGLATGRKGKNKKLTSFLK